ncbi:uncharacterized protein [Nicotiana sylvestris]|uniref:uncharacterized protein n=1 Tax=Nicotiana sylvestris TaxID=4096 RepID=UPI00388C8662
MGVWTLFTDGASNVKRSELGIVLKLPKGSTIRQSIKTSRLTNNEAEYEAMIAGLELAKSLGAEVIEAKCDSLLVVNHVNKSFEVREDRMQHYLDKLQVTLHRFKEWTLDHVPREKNSDADALTNLGSSVEEDDIVPGTVVQLSKSVIEEGHAEINSTSLTWDWRNKYIDYLKNGKLPSDHKESRALRTKAARFTLDEDGTLYWRTFDGPLAVCLGPGDTDYVLREIHEGTYGNHSGTKSLVRKIIRAWYYWDSMEKDTKEFVKKCDKCQSLAPMIPHPGEQLHSVLSPWPFMKWGMDIVGPLPTALGKAKFILFMNDYFSKWEEAQAFKKVREKEVIDFIWDHIQCWFGIPAEIV